MKFIFFELEKDLEESIRQSFADCDLYFNQSPLNSTNAKKSPRDASLLCVSYRSHVTKEIIDSFTNLSCIVTRSTGFDHIDLNAAQKRNITVCSCPTYAKEAVAEHTIALLFSLARNIPFIYRSLIDGQQLTVNQTRGFELKDKTLGVIGTGNIGTTVLQLAHCLGMKTIAYDINPNPTAAHNYHFQYVSFEKLLKQSDIISLHLPLNEKTHHIIDLKTIAHFKKGSYLINTARGALVQSEALLHGLNNHILAGAAIDVLENESFLVESQNNSQETFLALHQNNLSLLHHPNLVITPHIAYNTHQAVDRLMQDTIKAIKAWQEDRPIHKVVL